MAGSGSGQPWLHELTTVLSAPTVALSDPDGQIRADGAQGVLHADARVLSLAVLEVDGMAPAPISAGLLAAGRALFVGSPRGVGGSDVEPAIRVEREREVTPGRLREMIRLDCATTAGAEVKVSLRVAADLAGIGDIKNGLAGRPAEIVIVSDEGSAELAWGSGRLRARLTAAGATAQAGEGEVVISWPVRLPGRGQRQVSWELTVEDSGAAVVAAGQPGAADQAGAAGQPGAAGHQGQPDSPWVGARARGDDPRLAALLERSLADAAALRMAVTSSPGDVFLAAGAPWFLTLFGRDSIWSARLLLPFGWQLAAGTLRALARHQGRAQDLVTGEAPGKIPHELRAQSRPAAGERGQLPPVYYGTVDATPLWICLLHDAWRWGMPADQVRSLLPNLVAALRCLRDYGDADGDGFLEYIDHSGRGLANQGWKDSWDAIRFADGTVANAPVALCEVQGYAHEAAIGGARLLDAFGEPGAGEWRAWAARLAAAFRARFWVSDGAGRYPALALDAAKRPVDSVTSNIGHLLGTGLLSAAEESLVAARLMGPDMDSGFGLRTMSVANGGYSALSYHCGSVWSHDTAIVIRGLARGGHHAAAGSLAGGLLAAASAFGWRLPELFSGEARARVPWPSPYPAACRPQAWAAASAGALVQALLGLEADLPAGRLTVAPAPGAGRGLRVDGLVAGSHSFGAGTDEHGAGYLDLPGVPRPRRAPRRGARPGAGPRG